MARGEQASIANPEVALGLREPGSPSAVTTRETGDQVSIGQLPVSRQVDQAHIRQDQPPGTNCYMYFFCTI
jgi:hypothetical protein